MKNNKLKPYTPPTLLIMGSIQQITKYGKPKSGCDSSSTTHYNPGHGGGSPRPSGCS